MAPRVKLLLPAHNIPVANPEYLGRLKKAVEELQSGTMKPQETSMGWNYAFDSFSFLLATPYQAH